MGQSGGNQSEPWGNREASGLNPLASGLNPPAVASDPVEVALADALTRAAVDKQWATVEVLTRELQARREARAGVVELNAERAKRKG